MADLSGDITPDPVTSPSGKAFITFSTNYTVTAQGWEIYYETDLVGVSENSLEEELLAYPNPVKDKLYISYTGQYTGILEISLANLIGQVQLTELHTINSESIVHMDVSGIESGLYLLRMQMNGEVVYRKILLE